MKKTTNYAIKEIVCCAVGVPLLVVSMYGAWILFENERWGLLFLPIIGIIVSIILFIVSERSYRNRLSTCSKCNAKLEGCEYSYQLVSSEYKTASSPNSDDKIEYVFEIIAVCPNCGESKVFRKSFKLKTTQNAQYEIEKYCRGLFRH